MAGTFGSENRGKVSLKVPVLDRGKRPARCDAITPGGSVEINIGKSDYALPGLVATIDGSTDYYFYGTLDSSKRGVYCEYDLLVVEQDPVRGFATTPSSWGKLR